MSKLHTEAMKRLEKKKKSKKNEAVGVWSEVIYRLSRNRAAVFGFCVIVILAFFAIFPQTLTQSGYDDQNYSETFIAPCAEHPMGTDDLGRDILTRIVYGARISLTIGIVSMLCSLVVGGLARRAGGGKQRRDRQHYNANLRHLHVHTRHAAGHIHLRRPWATA